MASDPESLIATPPPTTPPEVDDIDDQDETADQTESPAGNQSPTEAVREGAQRLVKKGEAATKKVVKSEVKNIAKQAAAKLLETVAVANPWVWVVGILLLLLLLFIVAVSMQNSSDQATPRTSFQKLSSSQSAQTALKNIVASAPKATGSGQSALGRYVLPATDITDLQTCQSKPADCEVDARVIQLLDELGRQFGHVEASIRDGYATNPPVGVQEPLLSREQDPGKVPVISSHTLGQAVDVFALGTVSEVGSGRLIPTKLGWARSTNDDLNAAAIPLLKSLAQTLQPEAKTATDQSNAIALYQTFNQNYKKLPTFPSLLNQTEWQPVGVAWNSFIGSLRAERHQHDLRGQYDPTKPLNQLHAGQPNPLARLGFTSAFWPTQTQAAHWSAFFLTLDSTFSTLDKLVRESRTSVARRQALQPVVTAGQTVIEKAEKVHTAGQGDDSNADPLESALAENDFETIIIQTAQQGGDIDLNTVLQQVSKAAQNRHSQGGWTEQQESAAETVQQVNQIIDQAKQAKTDIQTVKQQLRDKFNQLTPQISLDPQTSAQIDQAMQVALAVKQLDEASIKQALQQTLNDRLKQWDVQSLLNQALSRVDPTVLSLSSTSPSSADSATIEESVIQALRSLNLSEAIISQSAVHDEINRTVQPILQRTNRSASDLRSAVSTSLRVLINQAVKNAQAAIDAQVTQQIVGLKSQYNDLKASLNKQALQAAAKQAVSQAISQSQIGQDIQAATDGLRQLNQVVDQYIKDANFDAAAVKQAMSRYVRQQYAEQITQPIKSAVAEAEAKAKQQAIDSLEKQLDQQFTPAEAAAIKQVLSGDISAESLANAAIDAYCNTTFGPIAGPIVAGVVKDLVGSFFGWGDSFSRDLDQYVSSVKDFNAAVTKYEQQNGGDLSKVLSVLATLDQLKGLGQAIDGMNNLPNPVGATADTPAIKALTNSLDSLQALSSLEALGNIQSGSDLPVTHDLAALDSLRYLGELRQLGRLNISHLATLDSTGAILDISDADIEPTDARTAVASALQSLHNLSALQYLQKLDVLYPHTTDTLKQYDSLSELAILGNLGDILANQSNTLARLQLNPLRLLGSDTFKLDKSIFSQLDGKAGLGLPSLSAWANPPVAGSYPSLTLSRLNSIDLLSFSDSSLASIAALGRGNLVSPDSADTAAIVEASRASQDVSLFRPAAQTAIHNALVFVYGLPINLQPRQSLSFDQDGPFDPENPAVGSILSQSVIDHIHFGY